MRRYRQLAVGIVSCAALLFGNAVAADTGSPPTDMEISNAVDDAFLLDPAVDSVEVDVSTSNGVVTVTGAVESILEKDRATAVAETVKGVRAVVNRITVTPPLRSDTEIEEDIEDALITDPATDSWEIEVSVSDGIASLSGTVDSWQEKELASTVAKGVNGVTGVENDIAIDYETDRSDSEIRAEVRQTLRWDTLVDDALITVEVDDGNVTLDGTVGSATEKSRAETQSWVAGVQSVDASDLDVESWARDERFREGKYVSKTNAQIEEAVKDAFLYDPRVNMFDISVEVDGGIATLRGVVDNLKAKRSAAQDARNVVGVWVVNNFVKVRPSTPSDRKIEQNVEDALVRDPYVERYELSVNVIDGEVYLAGVVDTVFEKSQADDVAAAVYGVTDVHNNIVVGQPDELTYDPYTDDTYPYDYDWLVTPENATTNKSDWEILEEIQDELFWSPFVDEDEVTVTVDDGIATLTGTVDTWDERAAATENALEGGALSVDNDLAVRYGPEYYQD